MACTIDTNSDPTFNLLKPSLWLDKAQVAPNFALEKLEEVTKNNQ